VVAKSTGDDSWASDLFRIRGDVIHKRSLFLAYEGEPGTPTWRPIFTMNWRPGHFGPNDRITVEMLVGIWEGLKLASIAMRDKIVSAAMPSP